MNRFHTGCRTGLLLWLSFFLSVQAIAQREATNWYFGQSAGLSFATPTPTAILQGGTNSEEGCAAISDNQGRLLFYTNGTSIINRAHLPMKNGSGLNGDQSSTQGVLIVPQPGNDSLYYVFTNGAVHMLLENGLKYSVVNIKGDNGFGEVLQKNQSLLVDTYERISAIRHCNNIDVWIMVRKWESNQYYAYLLTASGLNSTPVISATSLVVGGDINYNIGAMKFSSKGNKMACAFGYGFDRIELMDFDRQTGRLSNPVVFRPNTTSPVSGFPGVYGLEFSPDNGYLYTNCFNDAFDSRLFQFNIRSHNASAIEASRQLIHTETSGSGAGNIQIALDGKLYVAFRGRTFLSVIESPENPGLSCNFRPDAINLDPDGNRRVSAGLPNFIQSYFDRESNPYDFYRTGSCDDLSVPFKLNYTTGIDSVRWDFGDGNISTVLEPVHNFSAPGFYNISLFIFKPTCSGNSQEIRKRIWVAPAGGFLGEDKSFCPPGSVQLSTGLQQVSLTWNNGSINDTIQASQPGIYWLEASDNGCTLRDSVQVSLIPPPVFSLGPDTSVCRQQPVVLRAPITGSSYVWSTGDTGNSIEVIKPGTYSLTIETGQGCAYTDSVLVLSGDCGLYMPSAFTPNRDGLNDFFGPVDDVQANSYELTIYNRYGQKLFHSKDTRERWDGNIQGKPAPIGTYIWILQLQQKRFLPQTIRGTVLLFR